jgi:predicted TIM-barrel fold metal-dependent hydrolase
MREVEEPTSVQIHNCHVHLLTSKYLPEKYWLFSQHLAPLLKSRFIRTIIGRIMRLIGKLFPSKKDWINLADRLPHIAAFAKMLSKEEQDDVFTELREYYPGSTRFVVLPMDFLFMGLGDPPAGNSTEVQHNRLAELRDRVNATQPGKIIPFAHFDPRRDDAVAKLQYYIEEKQFKGVKIYPPLGYDPGDPQFDAFWQFCDQRSLPVMTHCSGAVVRSNNLESHIAAGYCDPENYKPVLAKYSNLRLCLAHFGGDSAWDTYLNVPNWNKQHEDPDHPEKAFLFTALEMLQSGNYPSLYVDIAYVIFHYRENSKILKVLLADTNIRNKVLFGTDFYMVKIEKFSEKQLSMFLRADIGETNYRLIAETNPRRYLQQ